MPLDPKKHAMPVQDAAVRAHNFDEVALGYTPEIAFAEAARCLNCKNAPCVQGCPVNIDIPGFIAKLKNRDAEGAYQVISASSSLPAVCGRVCPQETQCESKCTMGIRFEPVGIGRLERFAADTHNAAAGKAVQKPAPNGHKVAVVGSGPSSLTCAGDLARKGYTVTVFEAPGPLVTMTQPTSPVARAYPSAACTAACSCRARIWRGDSDAYRTS